MQVIAPSPVPASARTVYVWAHPVSVVGRMPTADDRWIASAMWGTLAPWEARGYHTTALGRPNRSAQLVAVADAYAPLAKVA